MSDCSPGTAAGPQSTPNTLMVQSIPFTPMVSKHCFCHTLCGWSSAGGAKASSSSNQKFVEDSLVLKACFMHGSGGIGLKP